MSNSKWAALGAALLASTALTTSASAAEWTAKISGSATVGAAFVDIDDSDNVVLNSEDEVVAFYETNCPDCENIALLNDAEVDFDFKLVADNGITFAYHMELNNEASGNFDEFNASVSGSFGTVELGMQDGAYDKLLLTPPGCSFSCPGDNAGFLFDYYSTPSGGQGLSNVYIDGDGSETSDDLKITYYTPKFMGFQAGVSYIPDGSATGAKDSGNVATDLTATDATAWEFGARWQGDITEDIDFGISGGYAMSDENGGLVDEDSWSIAAEVGLFGGSVGGRYTQDNGHSFGEESVLSLGAEYGTGPWGFFVNWAQTLDSDHPANDGDWGLSGEVDYDLAPGVKAGVAVEYGVDGGDTDFDSEFAIGTFLGMTF